MVGRDGFFIKVTLKYGEYFHVTYRRTETQCISNDLFSGVKKFPCLLYYLEVLEVVTVAHLALFLWFYSLLRWYKKKKNNNCTMHKGNGSRVWNISCLKNESGYFIERKASFFVQQIHFFPTQEILTLKNMLNVEMFLKNVKKQLMISVIWMYLLNVREKKGMQERYLLVSSAVQPWIEGHSLFCILWVI